jgi:predicted nucleic acid-binding Zn ribbon protein
MRRRKKQTKLQSIGEVLFSILKKRGMTSKIEENALVKLWPKAVGTQIASKTKPDCLRNGTLFVKTVSPVWVQQLHFVKEEIREKLNQLSGNNAVKEIRFLVGHTLASEKEEENIYSAKKTTLKKRDREMIAQCTDALTDQELAAILRRVMQTEISRRRQRENGKVR